MRTPILLTLLVASLGGAWAGDCAAQEGNVIELRVPRTPGPNEAVELQVTTGSLPPGARLEVLAERGESYGAAAPFGPRRDKGTTATVPIPKSALTDGRVRLRLQVTEPGAPPRAPRPQELRSLNLVIAPQTR
jgi:hypothetical protein